MKFSLLTNVKNDPASPWDAVAVIGHVAARIRRTIMRRIAGDDTCKPLGRNVADEVARFGLPLYLCGLPHLRRRVVLGERKILAEAN